MAVRAIGRRRGKRELLATVDYTLAKRALLAQMRTGLLGRADICDAHPELLRAAKNVGENSHRECPVCAQARLRLLAYVYGDSLKQDNGRVWPLDVGLSMAADRPGSWCYVVEVCTECQWNHLSEAFVARAV
ncbi:MAG: DUF5318 family protein [Actinomycetota bacterium]|jgi:hypothetical protein